MTMETTVADTPRRRPLMAGHLYPAGRGPGCLFRVYPAGRDDIDRPLVRIVLESPYEDAGVVDEVVTTLADLGPWLEGRSDY